MKVAAFIFLSPSLRSLSLPKSGSTPKIRTLFTRDKDLHNFFVERFEIYFFEHSKPQSFLSSQGCRGASHIKRSAITKVARELLRDNAWFDSGAFTAGVEDVRNGILLIQIADILSANCDPPQQAWDDR